MDKVAVKLGGQYLSIYDEKNIQKIDNYIWLYFRGELNGLLYTTDMIEKFM
jgi:hypothetical protein